MKICIGIWFVCWTLILYTYVLFPLLLAFYAQLRERTTRRRQTAASRRLSAQETLKTSDVPTKGDVANYDSAWPRVAMVVAAYNEAACLPAKLENTWALDYPSDRLTLYIGSDGSEDGTEELLQAETDPRLRASLFPMRRGKISVLNDLMQQVDADIVVMSDANTSYAPDALRNIVRHFEDERVGCVSGELRLERAGGVSGEGLYWRYECWIKRQESRLGFLIGCNGGIFALRKALYTPLSSWTIVEDFVISMRVLQQGYQVRYESEAQATEPACESSRAEMVRKIRIGAGNFQALLMTRDMLHPRRGAQAFAFWGHKVLRWLVPQFFLIAFAANIALAKHPLFLLLLLLQASGACVAVWAYNIAPGVETPRWTRPVSYFYLMNYALLCGFIRILLGKQKVTWERASQALGTPLVPEYNAPTNGS